MIAFEDMSVMSRANSLAYYEILGDASWMNFELEKYGFGNNGRYFAGKPEYFQKRQQQYALLSIQEINI